jgi:hypothetical protein
VGIEGMNISPVKVVAMGFSPIICLLMLEKFKANFSIILYLSVYVVVLVCCGLLSSSTMAWERVFYRGMFLLTFACIYQIIYSGDISIIFFRKLITFIVCAYGVDFLLQHIAFMVGVYSSPVLNLTGAMTMDGGLKANGLAIEPSHAGRILTFLYWGEMALTEIMAGKEMTFKEHLKENPWSTIAFWGTMVTMGSATAMLGAALIVVYFFKKRLDVYIIGLISFIIIMNIKTDIESLERLKNVFNAFLSDDVAGTIEKTESSGSARIIPMIHTVTDLNVTSWQTWVGLGTARVHKQYMMYTVQKVGDITDFGLFSYIFSLLLVFTFCIRRLFCIETLIFLVLFGFAIGSLYSCWGAMITFTAIKYYSSTYIPNQYKTISTE